MRITNDNGRLEISAPGSLYGTLVSVPTFSWNRRRQVLEAPVTMDTLDAVAAVAKLPSDLEALRKDMHARRRLMERMRVEEQPQPAIQPPVKVKLFDHQVRAYNMALLHFGALDVGGDAK